MLETFSSRRALGLAVLFFLAGCWQAGVLHGQAPEPVTICAYNLKNWLTEKPSDGSGSKAAFSKPEAERQRVIRTLLEIQPDILGVCEIGSEKDLQDLQRQLKAQGLDLPNSEHVHGGDLTRSLGLLSRLPIVSRQPQMQLEYQMGDLILPMQRGILDVTVEIGPGVPVRLLGVHLKSKREVLEADEQLMRRNEAHLLRLHMDKILADAPETKMLCYGDFNEHRNEAAIAEIIGSRASGAQMTDISLHDDQGQVWTHFWDAADVYSRFDYFFVSRTLRPLVNAKGSFIYSNRDFEKASDHRPIVLSVNPSAPTKR